MLPKIIISHDVDHLYGREHWFRDLSYQKLWFRTTKQLVRHEIPLRTFAARMKSPFQHNRHRIRQVMDFDKAHGVPSTFFFGMSQGLGMSYRPEECMSVIEHVMNRGFDAGVHGVAYTEMDAIQSEHDLFSSMFSIDRFGIREHYVRRDESTLLKLEKAGYLFDTTVFNKDGMDLIAPYKVGDMWEFPLHVMDSFIIREEHLQQAIDETERIIAEACTVELPCLTFLFHDIYFDEYAYPTHKSWYVWLIEHLQEKGFAFISYRRAIEEMDKNE